MELQNMEIEFVDKVLLLKEDQKVTEKMKTYLENGCNLEVIIKNSSRNALKSLEEENFDLIVSEFQMTEISGIEFLKKTRIEKRIDIPFIFFTEKKNQKNILKALNAGANRVIHMGDDTLLSCQILKKALKQEKLNYELIKELKSHRKRYDSKIRGSFEGFGIFNIR